MRRAIWWIVVNVAVILVIGAVALFVADLVYLWHTA